ncbi:MAG TPA: hypothetical protein VMS29_08330, partial [Pyrinomonadaceae bacterium]|nr:hypothetical protein [Pyrinomonadaceae bacterium]
MVPGVPLKNPLWDPGCRVGPGAATNSFAVCEPYVNPAAFMRPPKGEIGNAARTLSIREPTRRYFDLSIQKDFPLGGDGKRKINFRVDALNVLNMPNFYLNSRGNTPFGWGGFPVEFNGNECISNPSLALTACPNPAAGQPPTQRTSVLSEAEYTAWATFNSKPPLSTPEGRTLLGQIRGNANAVRLAPRPGQPTGGGALPNNFFSIPVPEGFATRNPLVYDISTLDGFKVWRLRNAYESNFGSLTSGAVGNSFGSPTPGTSSRYLQFGVRIIF